MASDFGVILVVACLWLLAASFYASPRHFEPSHEMVCMVLLQRCCSFLSSLIASQILGILYTSFTDNFTRLPNMRAFGGIKNKRNSWLCAESKTSFMIMKMSVGAGKKWAGMKGRHCREKKQATREKKEGRASSFSMFMGKKLAGHHENELE